MAKKSTDQQESPKKFIQNKIVSQLLQEFHQLETLVGKKEFAKRLKKSAKIITQGLKFEDVTKDITITKATPSLEARSKAPAKKSKTPPTKKATPKKVKPAVKKAKPTTGL